MYKDEELEILLLEYMNRNVRKCTLRHVHPVKIQIRLRIRAVWSESSLGAFFDSKRCLVSSCGQARPWSDCADAQADLSVRWAHMPEGMFSHVAVHSVNTIDSAKTEVT